MIPRMTIQQRVALRRKRAEEIANLERQLTAAVAADDRTLAEILRGQISMARADE